MSPAPVEHRISIHLGEVLAERGMSQVELSEKTGVHEVNISKLKNGHVKGMTFATLSAICQVLDCQPGDLLTYSKF